MFADLSLVTVVRKIYSKKNLVSWTNSHRDVTNLANHEMVNNAKTWISWERNITFDDSDDKFWEVIIF